MNRLMLTIIGPSLRASLLRDIQSWADIAAFRRRVAAREARDAAELAALALVLRGEDPSALDGFRDKRGPAAELSVQSRRATIERWKADVDAWPMPKPPRPMPPPAASRYEYESRPTVRIRTYDDEIAVAAGTLLAALAVQSTPRDEGGGAQPVGPASGPENHE